MASASVGPSSGGRRKSLDAEINLVPFIDLLSMCICFLLMTAVWLEIRSLHIKQLVGTEVSSAPSAVYEMDVIMKPGSQLDVLVKKGNKVVKKFEVKAESHEALLPNLTTTVAGILPAIGVTPGVDQKAQIRDLFSAARVTPDGEYNYGDLVGVMDVIRDWGLPNLGVVPKR